MVYESSAVQRIRVYFIQPITRAALLQKFGLIRITKIERVIVKATLARARTEEQAESTARFQGNVTPKPKTEEEQEK